jgi:hypothetical protein
MRTTKAEYHQDNVGVTGCSRREEQELAEFPAFLPRDQRSRKKPN